MKSYDRVYVYEFCFSFNMASSSSFYHSVDKGYPRTQHLTETDA